MRRTERATMPSAASFERARAQVSVAPALRRLVLLGGLAAAGWVGLSLVSGATAGAAPSHGQPESSATVATSTSTSQQPGGTVNSLLGKGIGGAVDAVTKTVDPVTEPVQKAVAAVAQGPAASPAKSPTAETEAAAKTPAPQGDSASAKLPVVDQLGESNNAVGEITAPIVTPVLKAAEPVTKPIAEAAAPVTKPVDDAVRQVTDSVDGTVRTVTKPLKPVTDTVAMTVAPVTEQVAETVVEPVAKAAAPVAEKVSTAVVKPVAEAVEPVTDPVSDQVVKPAVDAVTGVTGDVSDQVEQTVPDLEIPGVDIPEVATPEQPDQTAPESNPAAPAGDAIAPKPTQQTESPVAAPRTEQRQPAESVPAPVVHLPNRSDVESIAVPTPQGYDAIAAVVGTTDVADQSGTGQSSTNEPQQPAPAQPAAPGQVPAANGGSSSTNSGAGSGPNAPVACTSERWAVGLAPAGVADDGRTRSLKGDATKPPVSPA